MECRDKACQIRKESKKKADSFDEKKPRKTAIAFTNSLKSLTNSKSSKSTAASQNNKSSKKVSVRLRSSPFPDCNFRD